MQVLITGSSRGQLLWELTRTVPDGVELVTPASAKPSRLDITDENAIASAVAQCKPDVIINAAAYTAVDAAESDATTAFAVNATGVQHLATAAREHQSHLLHVSTDFVFGKGDGSPFGVNADIGPVSVYGQSKLEGERAVLNTLPDTGFVVRTAWVYSSHGNNFVKTMLRIMNERGEVGVIADQIGSPTWARSLANALWAAALKKTTGMHHWTGAGAASWYDFAIAIAEEGKSLGLLTRDVTVNPLRTDQYPTAAARPHYSVLELTRTWNELDLRANHWREDLRTMLRELL